MQRKVFFRDRFGSRIAAILATPRARTQRIAILWHGFASSKDSGTYLAMQPVLLKNGIAVLRADFFGHGESSGNFADVTLSRAVEDVRASVRFARRQGFRKVFLVGSSFGGAACLCAAPGMRDLGCLVLKCPVSNYLHKLIVDYDAKKMKEWRTAGFIIRYGKPLNYSFFRDASKWDGWKHAGKISCPTLIVHGDKDVTVPISQSKKTARLIGGSRLVIVKGADHRFSKRRHFARMVKSMDDFIIAQH